MRITRQGGYSFVVPATEEAEAGGPLSPSLRLASNTIRPLLQKQTNERKEKKRKNLKIRILLQNSIMKAEPSSVHL
jgi:hypothetical protein